MGSLKKYYFGCSKCRFDQYGYDADFAKVLKRACQLKFILPTIAERVKINQLFLDLKSSGVWSKQDQILNFAYNNTALQNFSLINWKNPSAAIATLRTGIAFTVNGFKGDAVGGCIDTSFNPFLNGVNYSVNNAGRTAILYFNPAGSVSNSNIDGCSGGGMGGEGMFGFSTVAQRITTPSSALSPAISMDGVGTRSINRDDATNIRIIKNATQTSHTQASTSPLTNLPYAILRRDTNFGIGGVCYHMIGGSLTNTEVQNFRAAYNSYMTNIGLIPIA